MIFFPNNPQKKTKPPTKQPKGTAEACCPSSHGSRTSLLSTPSPALGTTKRATAFLLEGKAKPSNKKSSSKAVTQTSEPKPSSRAPNYRTFWNKKNKHPPGSSERISWQLSRFSSSKERQQINKSTSLMLASSESSALPPVASRKELPLVDLYSSGGSLSCSLDKGSNYLFLKQQWERHE